MVLNRTEAVYSDGYVVVWLALSALRCGINVGLAVFTFKTMPVGQSIQASLFGRIVYYAVFSFIGCVSTTFLICEVYNDVLCISVFVSIHTLITYGSISTAFISILR